ncbi:MAG: hypothetical protein JW940_27360 [Polyangiaceae bacterium]|nr:hypothetical protein [Polyangiaceae bacterium]
MTLDSSLDHALRRAARLSNDELKAELVAIVQQDRRLTAELLVHLGEVDARRLHTSWAFSSLFRYAVECLGFSEDEAYKRITAARLVRKFPAALGLIHGGSLHLSGLLVVAPHLTRDNHGELLGAACNKTKRQVEQLTAERFPRPDVPASLRKLPAASREAAGSDVAVRLAASEPAAATARQATTEPADATPGQAATAPATATSSSSVLSSDTSSPAGTTTLRAGARTPDNSSPAPEGGPPTLEEGTMAGRHDPAAPARPMTSSPRANEETAASLPARAMQSTAASARKLDRPRIEPLAAARYRVVFTASGELVQKLERAQELASHAVPPSDIAALFERALDALIAWEEKRRYATKPSQPRTSGTPRRAIPPGPPEDFALEAKPLGCTEGLALELKPPGPAASLAPERAVDVPRGSSCPDTTETARNERRGSRHVPARVRRAVFARDGGRCTFVDPKTGRRCDERRFTEFEHAEPHAFGGPPTEANLRTLCHAHNALLARRAFGEQYVAAVVSRRRGELAPHKR